MASTEKISYNTSEDTVLMTLNFCKCFNMKVGQQAFLLPHENDFHLQIAKEAYVDHTQFDKKATHYDHSSKADNPKWSMVDVQFERMTNRFIPLTELKKYHLQNKAKSGRLKDLALFTRARLSVQPLTEFDFVLSLENGDPIRILQIT
uniref:Thymocyte nuclear protein 1 n=1 Tax=Cyprinus carpio carpio TaxID=630221 RepID=A0A9J7ZGX3_CYPCA